MRIQISNPGQEPEAALPLQWTDQAVLASCESDTHAAFSGGSWLKSRRGIDSRASSAPIQIYLSIQINGLDQDAAVTQIDEAAECVWRVLRSVARAASASLTGAGFVAVSTAGIRSHRDHVTRAADSGESPLSPHRPCTGSGLPALAADGATTAGYRAQVSD